MNAGDMRCQTSDNFTFGSWIDKSFIYEMWFTLQNNEEENASWKVQAPALIINTAINMYSHIHCHYLHWILNNGR